MSNICLFSFAVYSDCCSARGEKGDAKQITSLALCKMGQGRNKRFHARHEQGFLRNLMDPVDVFQGVVLHWCLTRRHKDEQFNRPSMRTEAIVYWESLEEHLAPNSSINTEWMNEYVNEYLFECILEKTSQLWFCDYFVLSKSSFKSKI